MSWPSVTDVVVLAQAAVPVILAPNGTVATNGTITLGTALPTTYANAWVYLPAGAVSGGLAGLYFATFSSTTVGVITTTYKSLAAAFTPYIATGTVVATGSNSAYTQTTATDITLANITVPGGLMGANGMLRPMAAYASLNNANSKPVKLYLGGTNFGGSSLSMTSLAGAQFVRTVQNRGSQASQVCLGSSAASNFMGVSPTYLSIDTSVNKALTFTAQLTTATDYIVLEGFTVEVLPKA